MREDFPGPEQHPAAGTGLFGAASAAKDTSAAAAAPAAAAGSSSGAAGAPAAGLNATSAAVAPPSMLRGKTIEEIVNRWSTELETHVKEFNKFASEVAVWDRALIENGNNVSSL